MSHISLEMSHSTPKAHRSALLFVHFLHPVDPLTSPRLEEGAPLPLPVPLPQLVAEGPLQRRVARGAGEARARRHGAP